MSYLNQAMAPGDHLLTFRVPPAIPDVAARALSDTVNQRAEYLRRFVDSRWELLGTAYQASTNLFFTRVKVHGTPLGVVVVPIIQLIVWITGGLIMLMFLKDELITPLVGKVTPQGEVEGGIGGALGDIGVGLKFTGQGLGIGLAMAGFGVAVLGVLAFSGGKRH